MVYTEVCVSANRGSICGECANKSAESNMNNKLLILLRYGKQGEKQIEKRNFTKSLKSQVRRVGVWVTQTNDETGRIGLPLNNLS